MPAPLRSRPGGLSPPMTVTWSPWRAASSTVWAWSRAVSTTSLPSSASFPAAGAKNGTCGELARSIQIRIACSLEPDGGAGAQRLGQRQRRARRGEVALHGRRGLLAGRGADEALQLGAVALVLPPLDDVPLPAAHEL